MSENNQQEMKTQEDVEYGTINGKNDSKIEDQELTNEIKGSSSSASQEQKDLNENDRLSKELKIKESIVESNVNEDIHSRDGGQIEMEIQQCNENEVDESDQKDDDVIDVAVENGDKLLSKNAQKKLKRTQMWTAIKQKKKEQKKQEKIIKRQEKQSQENIEKSQQQQPLKITQQDGNHTHNCINQAEIPQKEGLVDLNNNNANENNNSNDNQNEQIQQIPHREPYKSTLELREQYSARMKNGQAVILDMQFLDLLEPKEFKSLVKQLCYMQSSNKKASIPSRFIITSANAKLKQALLANNGDKWGIEVFDQHYLEIFDKENIVYLSGDTEDDLEELEKGVAYVIGGLVDHNRLKNVTLDAANQQGLKVKRFPIQRYLKMETSSILACNHVFDIMVQRINGVSWRETLLGCIPQRKIVATIDENGREIPTEHYLKKLELMKKQQEEALLKKKLKENNNSIDKLMKQGEEKSDMLENQDNDQEEELY